MVMPKLSVYNVRARKPHAYSCVCVHMGARGRACSGKTIVDEWEREIL